MTNKQSILFHSIILLIFTAQSAQNGLVAPAQKPNSLAPQQTVRLVLDSAFKSIHTFIGTADQQQEQKKSCASTEIASNTDLDNLVEGLSDDQKNLERLAHLIAQLKAAHKDANRLLTDNEIHILEELGKHSLAALCKMYQDKKGNGDSAILGRGIILKAMFKKCRAYTDKATVEFLSSPEGHTQGPISASIQSLQCPELNTLAVKFLPQLKTLAPGNRFPDKFSFGHLLVLLCLGCKTDASKEKLLSVLKSMESYYPKVKDDFKQPEAGKIPSKKTDGADKNKVGKS